MTKKKLKLTDLKIKSFATVMNKTEQRTAKGGYLKGSGGTIVPISPWTEIKSGKGESNRFVNKAIQSEPGKKGL